MRLTHATAATDPDDRIVADRSTYQRGVVHLQFGRQLGVFITDAQADQLEQQLAARRAARETAEVLG